MPPPLPPLGALEAFESAARRGSFVAAADELHLSASAVSHRIRNLEVALGVRLFIRHARRVELTEQGRAYLPSVRRAFDELSVSTATFFGTLRVERRVTVRAPVSLSVLSIAPHIHDFTERHPDIGIRLITVIWPNTLPPESTDIEIRFGHGRWPDAPAELLCVETIGPVWTPSFVERFGPVSTIADITSRPRVHVLGYESAPATARTLDDAVAVDVTVDTSLSALEMVASGYYSTAVPLRFAHRGLVSGQLATLDASSRSMSEAHYLLFPNATVSPSAPALLVAGWLRSILSPGESVP